MRPNILYNYLQQTNAEGFVPSITREQKNYFRFELKEQPVKDMVYELTSHHISIYEKIDDSKSDLSPYHYTGYLKDKEAEENQYRIHVNFNYNGQVIGVVFSQQIGDSYFPIGVEEKLHEQFVELAQQSCEPVISKLRDDLNYTVAEYIKNYRELTKDAEKLSEDIEKNFEKYVTSLKNICDKLSSLMLLTEDDLYRSLYSATQRLQKAIVSQYKESKLESKDDDEEPKEEQLLPESPNVHSTPRKTQRDHLDNAISSLVLEFKNLSVEDELYAKGLATIFSSINEYSLLLKEHNYIATESNYEALSNLSREHQQAVNKLLYKLFLTQKLELAQHLSFAFTTPSFQALLLKSLELALHRKDSKLLDFLLTHGHFSVSEPLTVAGVEYASIMDYCEKNNPETDSMIDCVIVLIKHKAFLQCDERGMPIAYTIWSSKTHLFKMAFTRLHPVQRAALYCGLVPALKSYLSDHPDDPQKDTIESNMKIFVTISKEDSSHQALIAYGRMEKSNGDFESIRSSEALNKLADDPEILKLYEDLRIRCRNFVGPPPIQHLFTNMLNFVNLNMNQSILDGALAGLEKVSASTLKKNTIELLGKVNELLDCMETMMSFGSAYHKKAGKKGREKLADNTKLSDLKDRVVRLMGELQMGQNSMTVGGVLNLMQQPSTVVPSPASDSTAQNSGSMRTSKTVFFPATSEPKPTSSSTASPAKEANPKQTYKS